MENRVLMALLTRLTLEVDRIYDFLFKYIIYYYSTLLLMCEYAFI